MSRCCGYEAPLQVRAKRALIVTNARRRRRRHVIVTPHERRNPVLALTARDIAAGGMPACRFITLCRTPTPPYVARSNAEVTPRRRYVAHAARTQQRDDVN